MICSIENPNPIKSKELQYVFQPGRDHFPAKPYYDDGNPSMYTEENMKAREALRTHPNVKAGIDNFLKNFLLANRKTSKKENMEPKQMDVGDLVAFKTREAALILSPIK